MDVFFYEAFKEEASSLQELLGNQLKYDLTKETIQDTGHIDPPARLISIRTQSIIPVEWENKLDGVLSRSTGYDHLKKYLETIKTRLPCGYLQEYSTRAVAEHAILLVLSLMRRLPQQLMHFRQFDRDGLTGSECVGKKLLIVGVGRIGFEIAAIGSALGMNIRGVDVIQRHKNVHYIEKEEGIAWADAVICAMNLTKENRGYFTYDFLKRARQGVLFVNIARGEHATLPDLLRLIKENHLGGLGLDVFEDEPDIAGALRSGNNNSSEKTQIISSLLQIPNVILTPHNAFNTIEAVSRKSRFSVDEVFFFLKNKDFHNRVR
jgi:D-lactate dehydrogenase